MRRVAHLARRARTDGDQHLARRGDDRRAVVVDDVAEDERRAVEPRDPAQGRHVRRDPEVAVALLPVRHLVAGHRLHLHVEREQVVAALDPVVDHLVEEVLDLDALAEQPALHVGERGDDGVDRARLGLALRARRGRACPACRPGPRVARRSRINHASTATSSRRSIRRDLVLLERPDRPLVLVLRGHQVPDPEDERQQDRQRRVVDEAHVEPVVPGQTRRRRTEGRARTRPAITKMIARMLTIL